mmetsp:Transcript_49342/g.148573  ORF Transcript_49342/g.148573 Transcript_49342/m.148573 type:complete len:497 (-) Transcript_49342:21-1511(-)
MKENELQEVLDVQHLEGLCQRVAEILVSLNVIHTKFGGDEEGRGQFLLVGLLDADHLLPVARVHILHRLAPVDSIKHLPHGHARQVRAVCEGAKGQVRHHLVHPPPRHLHDLVIVVGNERFDFGKLRLVHTEVASFVVLVFGRQVLDVAKVIVRQSVPEGVGFELGLAVLAHLIGIAVALDGESGNLVRGTARAGVGHEDRTDAEIVADVLAGVQVAREAAQVGGGEFLFHVGKLNRHGFPPLHSRPLHDHEPQRRQQLWSRRRHVPLDPRLPPVIGAIVVLDAVLARTLHLQRFLLLGRSRGGDCRRGDFHLHRRLVRVGHRIPRGGVARRRRGRRGGRGRGRRREQVPQAAPAVPPEVGFAHSRERGGGSAGRYPRRGGGGYERGRRRDADRRGHRPDEGAPFERRHISRRMRFDSILLSLLPGSWLLQSPTLVRVCSTLGPVDVERRRRGEFVGRRTSEVEVRRQSDGSDGRGEEARLVRNQKVLAKRMSGER